MMLKKIKDIVLLMLLLSACTKDCPTDNPTCSHTPPTEELCAAYFERWFYNSEENSCEQIGYSGCNEWGFESLEACQDCDCD